MKVIVGVSGGVDSAVCAAMLMRCGYETEGVFLDAGLTSPDDARAVCELLGIPLTVIDITRELDELVCAPFVREYVAGRTPNPCIMCNPLVKFKALINCADSCGADFVATGHYARVDKRDGVARLLRSPGGNDQSYMLYRLGQETLLRLVLPLGEFAEKRDVRQEAARLGIPVADKPDSMEICFIPDGDYAAYIERRAVPPPPGDIVDVSGAVLGRHQGIHRHTLGQRRHLGVASDGRLYVTAIDVEKSRVVLGNVELLDCNRLEVVDALWNPVVSAREIRADVKVRHSRVSHPATVEIGKNGRAEVSFNVTIKAPSPGQSAVFYDGDMVLGGGVISAWHGR